MLMFIPTKAPIKGRLSTLWRCVMAFLVTAAAAGLSAAVAEAADGPGGRCKGASCQVFVPGPGTPGGGGVGGGEGQEAAPAAGMALAAARAASEPVTPHPRRTISSRAPRSAECGSLAGPASVRTEATASSPTEPRTRPTQLPLRR